MKARIAALCLCRLRGWVFVYRFISSTFHNKYLEDRYLYQQGVREFTLSNFIDVLTDKAYFNVTMRTVGVAIAVTIICAVLAIPMASLLLVCKT